MSLQPNLADLEAQHRALEAEISEALSHPSSDDIAIRELKRRKLQIKEQIERLKNEASSSIH
jgi:hypothetical protein